MMDGGGHLNNLKNKQYRFKCLLSIRLPNAKPQSLLFWSGDPNVAITQVMIPIYCLAAPVPQLRMGSIHCTVHGHWLSDRCRESEERASPCISALNGDSAAGSMASEQWATLSRLHSKHPCSSSPGQAMPYVFLRWGCCYFWKFSDLPIFKPQSQTLFMRPHVIKYII